MISLLASVQEGATLSVVASGAGAFTGQNSKRSGRVILVGNGKSLLTKKLGKVIDGFDVVGRYNYFKSVLTASPGMRRDRDRKTGAGNQQLRSPPCGRDDYCRPGTEVAS